MDAAMRSTVMKLFGKVNLLILFLTIFCASISQAGDVQIWLDNLRNAENLYELARDNPAAFDKKYPSNTLEETENSLKILKDWLSWLRNEQFNNHFFFPGFLSPWGAVESSKEKIGKQIPMFEKKINELKEKRRKLRGPSLLDRCLMSFQRLNPLKS